MNTKILAYHSIGNEGSGEVGSELYCVSVDNFRAQVEYISVYGVRCTVYGWDVKLTFDDGLLNNYTHAYPILREFGLKAYFFILAGKVGKNGYMNWQQIKELQSAGMIIGSHGITHRILTGLKSKDLNYELKESKKILEETLACNIDSLSIPRGFCNKKIIAKAREIGYKTIFTSDNRIAVKADWTLEKFVSVLNNGYSLGDKAVELAKNASKRVLGAKTYDKLRTGVLGQR